MTREVVSIAADVRVEKIVALFETRGIKRVPVLRRERLVGIVSRADLIRALVMKARPMKTARAGVSGGVVHYWGVIDTEDQRDAARVAAENVPGVRGVEDHRFMTYDVPSMT